MTATLPTIMPGATARFYRGNAIGCLVALGGFLLTRVDLEAGKRLAAAEDAEVYGTSA